MIVIYPSQYGSWALAIKADGEVVLPYIEENRKLLALAATCGVDYSNSEAAKQAERCEKATQYIKSLL